jgi:hypothetical protein
LEGSYKRAQRRCSASKRQQTSLRGRYQKAIYRVFLDFDVDAKERQIIWDNGEPLSIAASAQRIAVEHPEYPLICAKISAA